MNATVSGRWSDAYRGRVGFGIQAFAWADDPTPTRSILTAGQLTDELGLDAFFIGDHPAYAPEAWLHLAALAVSTGQVRLGSIVTCALYRHPVVVARLAADLDNLSRGRLILGLGIGWNAAEFAQLGLAFPSVPERQQALEEAVAIMRGVWGDAPFSYAGEWFSTEAARVEPPPVQRSGPPMLIAGGGERTTLRQVARLADACNVGPGHASGAARSPDDVRRKLAILRAHCQAVGRPYEEILRTHFTTFLLLGESERDVAAKLARYYPHGLDEEKRFSRVALTPDRAVTYYQALVDAGMQFFVIQTLDARDEETIRLLATEVAPRLQPRRGDDSMD